MRNLVLTATYDLRWVEKATYVTTLSQTLPWWLGGRRGKDDRKQITMPRYIYNYICRNESLENLSKRTRRVGLGESPDPAQKRRQPGRFVTRHVVPKRRLSGRYVTRHISQKRWQLGRFVTRHSVFKRKQVDLLRGTSSKRGDNQV